MIELTREQQIAMLNLARRTIGEALKIQTGLTVSANDPVFREKCGAFVTLHISGALRGCIGYIQGVKSIPETVEEMARAAAFRDPRFSALRPEEFEAMDIEISLMSPLEPVNDVSEIVVGRDGLIVCCGHRQGLLLPQVPVEQCWDLDTFLEHTCYKAGLPGSAWRQKDTMIQKFSCQVFGEKELGLR